MPSTLEAFLETNKHRIFLICLPLTNPNLILDLVDLPEYTYQLILVNFDVPFGQPIR